MQHTRPSDPFLYRILRFDRLVQMLETDELHFAHPSSWEDPFEGIHAHLLSPNLFAQCWCRNGVSDAMWRIYSPDKLGVLIRTTKSRLQAALLPSVDSHVIGFRLGNVRYVNALEYLARLGAIKVAFGQRATLARTVAPLFLKRYAFAHEAEVRAVVLSESFTKQESPAGIKIKVNTRQLIDRVVVDPRAPQEFVAAYELYLQQHLKFSGRVKRSHLYELAKSREA